MFPNSTIRGCLFALLSPLILATTCSAQTWTEARVLELFAHQSPQAVAARAQIAVTRADAKARALYSNPSFSYSREGAGFTEFFQAEQTLPLTGRIGLLRQSVAPAVDALCARGRCGRRLPFGWDPLGGVDHRLHHAVRHRDAQRDHAGVPCPAPDGGRGRN